MFGDWTIHIVNGTSYYRHKNPNRRRTECKNAYRNHFLIMAGNLMKWWKHKILGGYKQFSGMAMIISYNQL